MMKRKNKYLIIGFSILGGFIGIVIIFLFSIFCLKKYVKEVQLVNVENAIYSSYVLENEIGKIDNIEFQIYPKFKYEYKDYKYNAELTYKIVTEDKQEYIILVYIKDSFYNGDIYAYQIGEKLVYEGIDYRDDFSEKGIVESDIGV